MIGSVTLGTDDLDLHAEFCDDLLGTLGAKRIMELPETGFTMSGTGWDKPGIAVTRPYDGQPSIAATAT